MSAPAAAFSDIDGVCDFIRASVSDGLPGFAFVQTR